MSENGRIEVGEKGTQREGRRGHRGRGEGDTEGGEKGTQREGRRGHRGRGQGDTEGGDREGGEKGTQREGRRDHRGRGHRGRGEGGREERRGAVKGTYCIGMISGYDLPAVHWIRVSTQPELNREGTRDMRHFHHEGILSFGVEGII